MKKLLSILAIAGVMAACNSGNDESKSGDSSSMNTTDSSNMNNGGTTMGTDSSNMNHDSSHMGDSMNKK